MAAPGYEAIEPALSRNYFWDSELQTFQPIPTAAELDQLMTEMAEATGETMGFDDIIIEASYQQAVSFWDNILGPQEDLPSTTPLQDITTLSSEDNSQDLFGAIEPEPGSLPLSFEIYESTR